MQKGPRVHKDDLHGLGRSAFLVPTVGIQDDSRNVRYSIIRLGIIAQALITPKLITIGTHGFAITFQGWSIRPE